MSRRSQITRVADAVGIATPVTPPGGFTWNTFVTATHDAGYTAGDYHELPGDFVRHTSLGADVDTDYGSGNLRIRIPRDGVYSVSARASMSCSLLDGAQAMFFRVACTSTPDLIDETYTELSPFIIGGGETPFGFATPLASHAGWPLFGGDVVYASLLVLGEAEYGASLAHLSVTYEAELGTVATPPIGGG